MATESKETNEAVEIEVNEIATPEPTAFATDGLLPQEVDMAKEHGLVEEESKEVDESSKKEEDDKHEEQPEAKTEDSEEVKPTFDDVEKKEDNLKKYNPNEQALYWKWKSDKKKKQAAVKDYEELKATYELNSVKEKSKVGKIAEALNDPNITVEALQAIIGVNAEKGDEAPLTKSDLKEIEAEKAQQQKQLSNAEVERRDRIETAENIGNSKYGKEEFEELTKLTTELVNSPQGKTYKKLLETSFGDKDTSEEEIVEQIATLAKMNPNYGKEKSDDSKKEKPETNIDRVIKNSKKKISSATVGSGSGKTTVSEDDITVDQAAKLTSSQWSKLKKSTRERLLM